MDSLVFLYLFPSYFNFQQHPDPIFCIIFNISLSPPPPQIQTPRKNFIYLKHSKNRRVLTFIEPMTTSLWPRATGRKIVGPTMMGVVASVCP